MARASDIDALCILVPVHLIKGGSVAWICADTCFVLQYQSYIFIVEFPYAKRRHAVA